MVISFDTIAVGERRWRNLVTGRCSAPPSWVLGANMNVVSVT